MAQPAVIPAVAKPLMSARWGLPSSTSANLLEASRSNWKALTRSRHQIIVIENRRKLGYDAAPPPVHQSGVVPSHGLIEEGVVVYTVDTLIRNGQLPIKIAGNIGVGRFDSFPVLTVGESVTLHGYTITITNDTNPTYTITITKTD